MLAIPNTTTTTNYTDAGAAVFPSDDRGALTPFVQGFLFIANNPAFVSLLRGRVQGSNVWTPDTLVQPTLVPITTDRLAGNPDRIWGVRARSGVAGSPAQVFGALFQEGEAAYTPGAQFTGTVAASGGFTPPGAGTVTVLKTVTPVTWNTSAATSPDLLSAVAAGLTLSTTACIRVTLMLDILNNSGAAATFVFSIYLGGVQIIAMPAISMGNSVNRQPLEVSFVVMNTAAAAQVWRGLIHYPSTPAGTSDIFNGAPSFAAKYGTSAVNTAAATTLQAAVQHSTASALQETKLLAGVVEIL